MSGEVFAEIDPKFKTTYNSATCYLVPSTIREYGESANQYDKSVTVPATVRVLLSQDLSQIPEITLYWTGRDYLAMIYSLVVLCHWIF